MGILRWLAGILIIFWLLGLVLNIGGGLIHILIVIAVIVFIFDIIGGRRRL
ncbi:lmo0937 family membrane protein [Clostridium sp.]|uniref:lmo0937 family membrane protein n=1 Tax=Clostridium sp. TaxID=1506 RepID=UPI003D6C73E2